jgi:serine/threonine protein kinase
LLCRFSKACKDSQNFPTLREFMKRKLTWFLLIPHCFKRSCVFLLNFFSKFSMWTFFAQHSYDCLFLKLQYNKSIYSSKQRPSFSQGKVAWSGSFWSMGTHGFCSAPMISLNLSKQYLLRVDTKPLSIACIHRSANCSIPRRKKCCAKKFPHGKIWGKIFMRKRTNFWNNSIKFMNSAENARNLLSSLLQYNPEQRIAAEAALSYPFVSVYQTNESYEPIQVNQMLNGPVNSEILLGMFKVHFSYSLFLRVDSINCTGIGPCQRGELILFSHEASYTPCKTSSSINLVFCSVPLYFVEHCK